MLALSDDLVELRESLGPRWLDEDLRSPVHGHVGHASASRASCIASEGLFDRGAQIETDGSNGKLARQTDQCRAVFPARVRVIDHYRSTGGQGRSNEMLLSLRRPPVMGEVVLADHHVGGIEASLPERGLSRRWEADEDDELLGHGLQSPRGRPHLR